MSQLSNQLVRVLYTVFRASMLQQDEPVDERTQWKHAGVFSAVVNNALRNGLPEAVSCCSVYGLVYVRTVDSFYEENVALRHWKVLQKLAQL